MAEMSPEGNMVRDEIRAAVRGLDTAVERIVAALDRGEAFVRGERRPPSMTRMDTPARPTALSDLRE